MSAMPDLDKLLDEVSVDPPTSGSATPQGALASGSGVLTKRLSYTHKAMIDQIIANPAISQNQLAALFGYSPSWISQVISSDTFQNMLTERTKDLVDPTIRASVDEQFKGLVYRSMELLREKLSQPNPGDNIVLRTLELSSRALGYGARQELPPVSPVTIEQHLHIMGENLTKLLKTKKAEAAIPMLEQLTDSVSDLPSTT